MKIHGEKVYSPGIAYAAIPRPDGDIIFTCLSVLCYDEFEALSPEPTPPWVRPRTGPSKQDYDDKRYVKARGEWATRRQAWMVIKSMQGTPGIEWETVQMGDPETWGNYVEELKGCGFSPLDISRIIDAVYDACGLNQKKIDEAMERFLSGERDKANAESSREAEVPATLSSEPANAST